MNNRRISAKNLGILKLPKFCLYDFYLELILWKKDVPFRFNPPRLINRLDPFQKNLIASYFDEKGELPKWLVGFKDVQCCCEVGKLFLDLDEYDLTFTGIPDLVVKFNDGTYGVIDFKTAYHDKDKSDPLRPMYEVQLNSYAYLLEAQGKEVSRLALAYFQGDTGFINENLSPVDLVHDWGHYFQFFVEMDTIKLSCTKLIPPLLKRVDQIFDLDEMPAMSQGCRNCERLADYLEARTGKRPRLEAAIKDKSFSMNRYGCPPHCYGFVGCR